jgi:hypothetical protein
MLWSKSWRIMLHIFQTIYRPTHLFRSCMSYQFNQRSPYHFSFAFILPSTNHRRLLRSGDLIPVSPVIVESDRKRYIIHALATSGFRVFASMRVTWPVLSLSLVGGFCVNEDAHHTTLYIRHSVGHLASGPCRTCPYIHTYIHTFARPFPKFQ